MSVVTFHVRQQVEQWALRNKVQPMPGAFDYMRQHFPHTSPTLLSKAATGDRRALQAVQFIIRQYVRRRDGIKGNGVWLILDSHQKKVDCLG